MTSHVSDTEWFDRPGNEPVFLESPVAEWAQVAAAWSQRNANAMGPLDILRPAAGQLRTVHVHVCERGSIWAAEHLAFRNALRADQHLAQEYALVKIVVAERAGIDRGAYSRGKSDFIRRVTADAMRTGAQDD